jgi:hypothetical protein
MFVNKRDYEIGRGKPPCHAGLRKGRDGDPKRPTEGLEELRDLAE